VEVLRKRMESAVTRGHFWCEPNPASLNDSAQLELWYARKDVGRGGEVEGAKLKER